MDDKAIIGIYMTGIEKRLRELNVADSYILGQTKNIRDVLDHQAKYKTVYTISVNGKEKEVINRAEILYGGLSISVDPCRDLSGILYKLRLNVGSNDLEVAKTW